jgi:nitrogen fixation protein NifQ
MMHMQNVESFQGAVMTHGVDTPEDIAFDRLIFRGALAHALAERAKLGGSLARRLGLGGQPLIMLLAVYMPDHPPLSAEDYVAVDESEEQGWVRDLLKRSRSTRIDTSRWLAAIIARRGLEAGHLWEDLGLPDRPTLRTVMDRHFPELSARNKNMRWKRFLYRSLCEEEGMSHCTSPTCSDCSEVAVCFEPDSAEAMMALVKRAPA